MGKKKRSNIAPKRESGIELLKIIAVFFIVISHVCQSVGQKPAQLPELYPKLMNLNAATTNLQYLVIAFFRHFGVLGNHIFLACSFWFLCNSSKAKLNKIVTMLGDVWVISVLYLFIYTCLEENLSKTLMTKCFFPTLNGNNWFITCYLLVYMIHPFLNLIIRNISQKTHAVICIVSLGLYFGVVFVKSGLLYSSNLVLFIVIYFLVAYMKNYMQNWFNKKKHSLILLVCGLTGMLGLLLLYNYLGLHVEAYRYKLLNWNVNNNPFILMTALALFHLFRQLKFKNSFLNYIAGCSLIIYLVHENILFRSFTRVRIWTELLEHFGRDTIVVQMFGYAIVLFLAAVLVSVLYQYFIHGIVKWLANYVETFAAKVLDGFAAAVMKLK
ncbi:MAG: acyltransferase family protein [Lachnospiraceae bacterium]|nr:acyltransferase family protein [Lachnospiraceae bacterium]